LDQHCSEEILSAYLDGDLGSEAAGTTAEHLAECPVCRQALAQVRTIRDAAPAMEQFVPPDRVWDGVRARIRGSRKRSVVVVRLFWVGAPALAAALLVVTLAGWFGQPAREAIRTVAHLGRVKAAEVPAAVAELDEGRTTQEAAREYGEYVHGIERAIDECRAALTENPGNSRVRAAYYGASVDRQRALDRLTSGGE